MNREQYLQRIDTCRQALKQELPRGERQRLIAELDSLVSAFEQWTKEHSRYRARKGAYNLAERVSHHAGKNVVDALRAQTRRVKRHGSKSKSGVLYVHRKGSKKRVAMPITIRKRQSRKGRGLSLLPEIDNLDATLLRHWWVERDGKPSFRTLTFAEILEHLPVKLTDTDTLKKRCRRLGLYHPAQ